MIGQIVPATIVSKRSVAVEFEDLLASPAVRSARSLPSRLLNHVARIVDIMSSI